MKKYYKRILATLLALIMVFSCMSENIVFAGEAAAGSTSSIDEAVEATVNAEVYFVHAATGKLISLDGTVNNSISCETVYGGTDSSVPANAKFTIYYGIQTSGICSFQNETVVNFTCNATQTSWASNGTNVYQITKMTSPDGWESLKIEPQGDGTIAFRDCAAGKYVTVQDNKLSLVSISEDESISSNEKFVIHTSTAPKTAKNVSLSDVAGDSVTVSWQGVDECLYSGYEVLYSTEENGTYTSAGYTADTTLTVTGLSLNTKYFFKVRTVTNNDSGAYADSKAAYTQTLRENKPSKPTGVEVEYKNGEMEISWNQANSVAKYKVYRAVSRFAEYTEIGETTGTTFTDRNPNASKYSNYYKIQAINDIDNSELSEPGSLEISMFGLDTYIFNETDDFDEINRVTNEVYQTQHYNQFGDNRFVLAYKPGDYTGTAVVNVGYYTQILGLGKTPYDVYLNNVKAPSALSGNNATCNFWVGIENLTIANTAGENADFWEDAFVWSVSQAAPARRLNVERNGIFHWGYEGWASGGFIADSIFQKQAGSWSQQQYYYRNCELQGGIYGVNWNQVVQGCEGLTAENSSDNSEKDFVNGAELLNNNGTTNWDQRGVTTVIDSTPEIREKPFLFFDTDSDSYKVFVPALREDSTGVSWSQNDMGDGQIVDVDSSFYIASPDKDTAETINTQLAWGKNIIFQPGIYHVEEPIQVNEPNTILLGLGMATIIPDNEEAAIKTADVAGLSICGLILDAGNYSDTLLTVGEEGCNRDHSDNPIVLQDVIYRVGGTGNLGRCASCQVINSNNVIIDHTWIWRADHGDNTGWTANTSNNGLVVNGDNVTAYGLFCEHFQEYDILWRGENGATYFLQNEKCYDPQSQESWMSHAGTKNGYAAYKVANNVKNHYAVGLGIYDVFINTNGASIYLDNAIEVPDTPGVLIENACIVEIAAVDGPKVGINHIINGTVAGINTGGGQSDTSGYAIQRLLSYCNGNSLSLPDYYTAEDSVEVQTQVGQTPTDDVDAERDIVKDELTANPTYAYPTPPLWEMTDDMYQQKQDACYAAWLLGQKTSGDDNSSNANNNNSSSNNQGNGSSSSKTNQGSKSTGSSAQAGKLTVGQTFNLGKYKYKITKITGTTGTVKLVRVRKKYRKTLKKATVKAKVSYQGYTFKVTVVGKKAFKNCTKLKRVTIGKRVKTIQKKAFFKCKKLKRVTLKKRVTTIKAKAFFSCSKLKKITIKGTALKKVAKNAFHKKVRATLKITAKKKVKKVILKSLKRKK